MDKVFRIVPVRLGGWVGGGGRGGEVSQGDIGNGQEFLLPVETKADRKMKMRKMMMKYTAGPDIEGEGVGCRVKPG